MVGREPNGAIRTRMAEGGPNGIGIIRPTIPYGSEYRDINNVVTLAAWGAQVHDGYEQ